MRQHRVQAEEHRVQGGAHAPGRRKQPAYSRAATCNPRGSNISWCCGSRVSWFCGSSVSFGEVLLGSLLLPLQHQDLQQLDVRGAYDTCAWPLLLRLSPADDKGLMDLPPLRRMHERYLLCFLVFGAMAFKPQNRLLPCSWV